jgi:hypothetical protein
MSGYKRGSEDGNKMTHPDDNTLLTYIGQPFPVQAGSGVCQHLALCEPCQLRYGELKRATDLLTETLAHFEDKQYYPPLKVDSWNPADVRLALQQRRKERLREDLALGRALLGRAFGGAKTAREGDHKGSPLLWTTPMVLGGGRPQGIAPTMDAKKAAEPPLVLGRPRFQPGQKEPRSRTMASVPIVAIPLVMLLVLLVVFVVMAANSGKFQSFKPFISATAGVDQSLQRIKPHAAATPTAKPVKVLPVYPVTATPSAPKPALSLCSIQNGRAQWRVSFCGTNFTAGDQVQLVEYFVDGQTKLRRPVSVSAQGTFQDSWIFYDCKMAPFSVIAVDVTLNHTSEASLTMQSNQFLNCVLPTVTPTVERPQSQI